MLNISKGNMYSFVTHTWNTVKGKCPHDCHYCYMKRFPQKEIRFDKKELKTDLEQSNFIFVGSSCDMWADAVPKEWIFETLDYCRQFKNKYLFQSKNPQRMRDFQDYIPINSVLGTTIETNRQFRAMGNAPNPHNRALALFFLSFKFKTMVTVEPIIDFEPIELYYLISMCNPEWINIGADSKNSNLPEPNADKINELVRNLKQKGITVKNKDNLKRLLRPRPRPRPRVRQILNIWKSMQKGGINNVEK